MADTEDLKSSAHKACEFESRGGHMKKLTRKADDILMAVLVVCAVIQLIASLVIASNVSCN